MLIGGTFIFVLAAICLLVARFKLTRIYKPDYADIEASRYMLGRWPRNWEEVRTGAFAHSGSDSAGIKHFDKVELIPLNNDELRVIFTFRDILGTTYKERRKLSWTSARAQLYRKLEQHTNLARALAKDYVDWIKTVNGGVLTANMSGISYYVHAWDGSDLSVHKVTLKAEKGNRGATLVIDYSDGKVREVLLEPLLKK